MSNSPVRSKDHLQKEDIDSLNISPINIHKGGTSVCLGKVIPFIDYLYYFVSLLYYHFDISQIYFFQLANVRISYFTNKKNFW